MALTNVVTKSEAPMSPSTPTRTQSVQNIRVQKNTPRGTGPNAAQFARSKPQTPEDAYMAATQGQSDLGEFYKKTKAREDADKKALKAFSTKTRDTERGITNTQSRIVGGYSEAPSPEILDKTIEKQFAEQKSITARAEKGRWAERRTSGDTSTTGNAAMTESESLPSPASALRSQIGIRNAMAAQLERKGALLSKKLARSTRWWLVGILSTLYMWQLLFALLSLLGFGLDGLIKQSYLGKALSVFINIEKLFPAAYLGYGAWGICTILSLSTFFCISLWYQFNRIHIFNDPVTATITLLCLSLSILPISNLFPFLLLWVLYMNTKSLFSNTPNAPSNTW